MRWINHCFHHLFWYLDCSMANHHDEQKLLTLNQKRLDIGKGLWMGLVWMNTSFAIPAKQYCKLGGTLRWDSLRLCSRRKRSGGILHSCTVLHLLISSILIFKLVKVYIFTIYLYFYFNFYRGSLISIGW